MTRLAFAAVLLAGCAYTVPGTRAAAEDERAYVAAARDAYTEARGAVECDQLRRVEVARIGGEAFRGRCFNPDAFACVHTVQRWIGAPWSVRVYVRDDTTATQHRALVVHEALHVLRGCSWVEAGRDVDVLRRGSSDECRISQPMDHGHCDRDLWIDVERDALQRLE